MAIVASQQKLGGAFYTDAAIAQYLADWAIRYADDRVLEPCFGAGVFLAGAQRRLRELAGIGRVVGTDIDATAWREVSAAFPDLDLHNADFFGLSPAELGQFDAVIGNPPFIRYHHFAGEVRDRALRVAAGDGVELSALTSAWAPFLVHATAHLRPGGRLAFVLPYEITYAQYARPVVEFLAKSFARISCLTFESPLFPEISENTVLLLAEGRGTSTSQIDLYRYRDATSLGLPTENPSTPIQVKEWSTGANRARLFDLPACGRELYLSLVNHPAVARLGDLADLTIGYVTGDNDYFHLSADDVRQHGLSASDVTIAVRRSSDLTGLGLEFTRSEVDHLATTAPNWLFYPERPLSSAAQAYVVLGEKREVQQRYKCRVRRPWYLVPSVRAPDLFLSVFSGLGPRLIANSGRVVGSNSVIVANLRDVALSTAPTMAASAITTLGQLSAEIEGHALGGGVLKFEPVEARAWLLPALVDLDAASISKIDDLLRSNQPRAASALADEMFLRHGLGLDAAEVAILEDGLRSLRRLRHRGRGRADGQLF